MTRFHRVIISLGLLTCPISAVGQALPSPTVSLEQAQAKVRALASVDPSHLPPASVDHIAGHPVYRFKFANGDIYSVYGRTGDVAIYYGANVSPRRTTEDISAARLPVTELEKAAREVMRARFPGASSMDIALRKPRFDGTCYTFSFVQVLHDNHAFTENYCDVAVGAGTGRVVAYGDHVEPIPAAAHRQPRVSALRVKDIAAWATQCVDVLQASTPSLVYANGRLRWSLRLKGIKSTGRVASHSVSVDADTGEPLEIGTYQLATFPQPPSNHVMLAQTVLSHAVGPIASGRTLLVSHRIVNALGGTVEAMRDSVVIHGERLVKIAFSLGMKHGDDLFVPATAIGQAYPSTIFVTEVSKARNAVNFICDRRSASLWHGSHGTRTWREPPTDRAADIATTTARMGIAATSPEMRRELPRRPAVLRGARWRTSPDLWAFVGLGAVACGMAALVARRRSQ